MYHMLRYIQDTYSRAVHSLMNDGFPSMRRKRLSLEYIATNCDTPRYTKIHCILPVVIRIYNESQNDTRVFWLIWLWECACACGMPQGRPQKPQKGMDGGEVAGGGQWRAHIRVACLREALEVSRHEALALEFGDGHRAPISCRRRGARVHVWEAIALG